MSGVAGIFKFDPRDRVTREELMELAGGIDRLGPDGGAEHLDCNLGMAYRAFHTTPDSHREVQPLVRRGFVLVWDGRLDNREEICSRIAQGESCTATDADLVFAAYQKWGTGCFSELIGDWALALWDQAKQQLILARDYIGVRRLFYRIDEDGVAWCTMIESLALTSPKKLHLDLNYLAGCFYPRPPVETTPYREIRAVLPASFRMFAHGGKQTSERYWSLNPHSRIRYSTDAEYETHFREIFRQSVNRRLRADRTVLAELSGGVDSSSIVCMADEIRKDDPGPGIETLSYFDADEPSGDERPFFSLVERKRGRAGYHISIPQFASKTSDYTLAPLPKRYFSASPGNFAKSVHWDCMINEIATRTGARVILSGLGGDEVLGGVQYEAPELAEHLLSGRLVSLFQSTFRWSLARKKTVYRLLFEACELALASKHPEFLNASPVQTLEWTPLTRPRHHKALSTFSEWHKLSPSALSMEMIRYGLAQQLTCTSPPLVGCLQKRYPYLDQQLFSFLASIPRVQILQSGQRRSLMRRALRGIVPDEVLFRKTKWFGARNPSVVLIDQAQAIEQLFKERWLSHPMIVDASCVRRRLGEVEHGTTPETTALLRALGIEQWLRSQSRMGTIELPL